MTDDATRAQNQAADPQHSTWLSANAGSGKTRVLTDRVARLLLGETEPQKILCLTYTKAAASEMQNRLFKRLGEWAMLPDKELRTALGKLGEVPPSSLARARTLFARAVEAPGGLKIQTIHSFCSSVLRQFPLEAGVSPRFRELDEPGQIALIEGVLDQLAREGRPELGPISRISSDETLTGLAMSVAKHREGFAGKLAPTDIFARFGLAPSLTSQDLANSVFHEGDIAFLHAAAAIFTAHGGPNDRRDAAKLAAIPSEPSAQGLILAESCLLTGASANDPFSPKIGKIPTKIVRTGAFSPHLDRFNAVIQRVADGRERRIALDAATRTAALHAFANTFLPAYVQAKDDAGALDFDDLIHKTRALLGTRSLEWVLYRLDSRIEHILVDEAQDTSPAQWEVIDALAREILAGEGARARRSIFVVGDKKQSIYSFQGADAREYDRMRDAFTGAGNGPALRSHELHFSFRSSSAILSAVDRVFDGGGGRGVGRDIAHRAFHDVMPGRVDLWPLIQAPEDEETPEWYDPVDRVAANHPRIQLAEKIADEIQRLIESGSIPGENGVSRRIRAGDFLILVQGRNELFHHIIRACKARGLPMAGADRLKIAGELAVKDLLALLSFLALQEDSLSLAAALRSPLFGWTEKDLYGLAQGRGQEHLWAELRDRRAEFPDTIAVLDQLLSQVDFLRPYELLDLILTRHGGRSRLLARLGAEAEDGIDELLAQALAYEQDAVPSLTGFLTRARSEDVEIKRQSDTSGDLIRVMTVHGAKGLEAPIVILPDTTRADKTSSDPILIGEDGTPFWRMSGNECPAILAPARELAKTAQQEERNRLLYVAMTRAEKWLIVCGTENRQNAAGHWHESVEAGLVAEGAGTFETPTGTGLRLGHGDWPRKADHERPSKDTVAGEMPAFLSRPAQALEPEGKVLSPSDLGGAKVVDGGARDEEEAKAFGNQMHLLLEHLPDTDRSLDAARHILGGFALGDAELSMMHRHALKVIETYPRLFAADTLAEVAISAPAATLGQRVLGTIDRLVIEPDSVTAVDFKTNAVVPATPEAVPEGILRQMGAYLEALEAVYPDKSVHLRILWTETASETTLEHGIVREALARTPTS